MTTNYDNAGADLSTILAGFVPGQTQATATGYKVGGADLNTIFAKLSFGSAPAATGYTIAGGADLNTVFAAFGTVPQAQATAVFSSSGNGITGIASDGTSQVVLCGYGGGAGHNVLAYSSNGNSFSASFTLIPINTPYSSAAFNDVCYVSGTGSSAIFSLAAFDTPGSADEIVAVYSTTGGSTWTQGSSVATTSNEGAGSIASNGTGVAQSTLIFTNPGSIVFQTSFSATPVIESPISFQVGVSQQSGALKYVNGNFVGLNSNAIHTNPPWIHSSNGTTWTNAPGNTGSAGAFYDIAYSSTLNLYVVVGQSNTSAAFIASFTSLTSSSYTAGSWPGAGIQVTSVVWIPSIGRFLAADNVGSFAYSSNGTTWTSINITPTSITGANPKINCGNVCGNFTYWGTNNGFLLQLANTAIP